MKFVTILTAMVTHKYTSTAMWMPKTLSEPNWPGNYRTLRSRHRQESNARQINLLKLALLKVRSDHCTDYRL